MSQPMQITQMRPDVGLALFYLEIDFTPICLPCQWPPPDSASLGLEQQSKLASAAGGKIAGKVQEVPFMRAMVIGDLRLAIYVSERCAAELERRESSILAQQILAGRDAAARLKPPPPHLLNWTVPPSEPPSLTPDAAPP